MHTHTHTFSNTPYQYAQLTTIDIRTRVARTNYGPALRGPLL